MPEKVFKINNHQRINDPSNRAFSLYMFEKPQILKKNKEIVSHFVCTFTLDSARHLGLSMTPPRSPVVYGAHRACRCGYKPSITHTSCVVARIVYGYPSK